MQKVTTDRPWPLFDVAATRRIEQAGLASLPSHTLMQRAGLATARLGLAVAPHSRRVWIACGPGNNGGDGLEAALHLAQWGKQVVVTLSGDPASLPDDARRSWQRFTDAGLMPATDIPQDWDLCIDALLGIGGTRPLQGSLRSMAEAMSSGRGPVIAIDVPSGLGADTGAGESVQARHTLALLTLKPGLFTGGGRDAAGQVWFDDLGVDAGPQAPCAILAASPPARPRLHASHKGSYGDVAVIGGAPGMLGAAQLAASAALHAGAGRVFLAPLDATAPSVVAGMPELMVRSLASLTLPALAVACGCGGGNAIGDVLPRVLQEAGSLVLDADALNAVAAQPQLQELLRARASRSAPTVLTPHPLEAARLLGRTTIDVQADRLASAASLVERFGCVVVLKGSGTVVAAPAQVPAINPTGNARLATGGTGDVLAGWIAALLAQGSPPFEAAQAAVFRHGLLADGWPADHPMTAAALAARASG
jgi:hydroxyethylthiazole kinase-like uncharacterized protein yjeF